MLIGPATVVLSVAAGKTIGGIARHCPAGTAIVRTIPNTPASVGRGITVATANAYRDSGPARAVREPARRRR